MLPTPEIVSDMMMIILEELMTDFITLLLIDQPGGFVNI